VRSTISSGAHGGDHRKAATRQVRIGDRSEFRCFEISARAMRGSRFSTNCSSLWYSQLHGCNGRRKRYPSLMEKLSELEHELAGTKAKIAYCEPRAVRLRLKDARQFAEARLKELQLVLNREPRVARAEIAKHVQKITLTPEGRTYIASGTWDVLGAENHGWCRGPGSLDAAHDPVLCQTGGLASDVVRFELTTFGL